VGAGTAPLPSGAPHDRVRETPPTRTTPPGPFDLRGCNLVRFRWSAMVQVGCSAAAIDGICMPATAVPVKAQVPRTQRESEVYGAPRAASAKRRACACGSVGPALSERFGREEAYLCLSSVTLAELSYAASGSPPHRTGIDRHATVRATLERAGTPRLRHSDRRPHAQSKPERGRRPLSRVRPGRGPQRGKFKEYDQAVNARATMLQ
jgi:hypothetical protein